MTATLVSPVRSGPVVAPDSGPARGSWFAPTDEQWRVIRHRRGRLRVLAGPGTGKTATIAAAVAARIADGVDPSSILVLTFARRAAGELASRIAGLVETTTVEPMVRTLHSYCYAVVRAAAEARGEPPPRMLGAGETDLVIRDLLAGHLEAGAGGWPEFLRPALAVPSFATDLREFLLRCAEREITPQQLATLARTHRRPEWRAVAAFAKEYREVTALRQAGGRFGTAFDQAELTVAALELLSDPPVLAAQQRRVRRVFVDEYQDVDPAQARLVEVLAEGADELVVVGDPDQAIYGFRGAVAGAMAAIDVDSTVALTASRRLPPALVQASRRVAARIPGPIAHRDLVSATLPADTDESGSPRMAGGLEVRVLPHSAAQAAFVADELRRAHLVAGVPWSRMAVLVRSPAASAAELRRALAGAGVPVAGGTPELPLAAQPLVRGLLAVLRAGADPSSLTGEVAAEILGSPIGGFDVVTLRRLRRAVRAALPGDRPAAEVLAAVLRGERDVPPGIPADLAAPLTRTVTLVAIARTSASAPAAEDALWRVWSRTGLSRRLNAASERGGRDGERADAMLDGVVALFDLAADLAVRLPGAGIVGLLDLVAGQQIPSSGPGPAAGGRPPVEAVTVLSAHAAKGLEWDTVVVAGVHQGTWPDLRARADLLGLADALDAAEESGSAAPARTARRPRPAGLPGSGPADLPPAVRAARTSQAMAEERRLFYVAVTRARRRLVVTAVEDDEHTPSPFLAELAGDLAVQRGWPRDRGGRARRALHLAGLLADLRRAVGDPDRPAAERDAAAVALARLAAAGVRGARPEDWSGIAQPSTTAPMVRPGDPVTLSPSQVEAVLGCPLRAVLTRHGGTGPPSSPQLLGVLVHALANGITHGVDGLDLEAAVTRLLDSQEHLPAWERAKTARLIASMTTAIRAWIEQTRAEREVVGSEVPVDVWLPRADPGHPGPVDLDDPRNGEHAAGQQDQENSGAVGGIRVVGRADWVSRDAAGRVVVTDFKTSASTPTRAEVSGHAQLAVYQIAAALGAFDGHEALGAFDAHEPAGGGGNRAAAEGFAPAVGALGGGELVMVRSGSPKTLPQAPLDSDGVGQWMRSLRLAADAVSGDTLVAREGAGCERCPVRSSCPLRPEGRSVTQ